MATHSKGETPRLSDEESGRPVEETSRLKRVHDNMATCARWLPGILGHAKAILIDVLIAVLTVHHIIQWTLPLLPSLGS